MDMRFEIPPSDGLVDSELVIRIVEATPRSRVNIVVETTDADGRSWRSSAQFLSSEDGTIDVSKDPPIQGSYNTLDAMALVTAMTPVGKEAASVFTTANGADLQLTFRAGDRDEGGFEAVVTRRFLAPGVQRVDVSEEPVYGTLFLPDGSDARPAVIVLGGVIDRQVVALPMAALLASYGYVAFVAEYFGRPGLPETLSLVPLEHFKTVAEWLGHHARVDSSKMAVLGFERGAEGAMAAAALVEGFAPVAVLTVAPSCVPWTGVGKKASSA